jgi:hypothetical protein
VRVGGGWFAAGAVQGGACQAGPWCGRLAVGARPGGGADGWLAVAPWRAAGGSADGQRAGGQRAGRNCRCSAVPLVRGVLVAVGGQGGPVSKLDLGTDNSCWLFAVVRGLAAGDRYVSPTSLSPLSSYRLDLCQGEKRALTEVEPV